MNQPWYRNRFLWLLLLLLAPQMLGMVLIPFSGTSEPRYAEIARLMAESGDWITPWFEPGIPFWGKPPLSFWAQALSIRMFGLEEWAVRLPSFLAFLATLVVIHAMARVYAGSRTAAWAVVVYASCALSYGAGVAVLTDPFLALGTTLCMAGLMLRQWHWRALGFIGLAIGLLAKGPLAVVLVAGSVATGWLICRRPLWPRISARSWIGGSSLVALLVFPWYAFAELKTPGFLNYFLMGEHFLRYLDPGWQGDLYGTAHVRPYGSIWLFWLMATFPWGIVAAGVLILTLIRDSGRQMLKGALTDPVTSYLVGWSAFTVLLFTAASNLLWTYVLPAIPAFAILMGRVLSAWQEGSLQQRFWAPRYLCSLPVLLVPGAIFLVALAVMIRPNMFNTERELVRYVQDTAGPEAKLWYINNRPFSARYYSRGKAELVPMGEVEYRVNLMDEDIYMAVPKRQFDQLQGQLPISRRPTHVESKRYVLVRIPRGDHNHSSGTKL